MSRKRRKGLFWHVHHDRIAEFSHDLGERIRHIKKVKASCEPPQMIRLRLRVLRPVKGRLPRAVARAVKNCLKTSAGLTEADRSYVRLFRRYEKALQAHHSVGASKTTGKRLQAANAAFGKAGRDYDEATRVNNEALKTLNGVILEQQPAMEALHRRQCRDCPWNGQTIFPKSWTLS